jgi:cation transport ATPase
MENEKREADVARRSARIYLPLALSAAAVFFLASGWAGDPGLVARVGGAFWVGLLTLIVSMPIVTSRAKKAARKGR